MGTHVPENADASPPHKRGWALQWRAGAACGESRDATDIKTRHSKTDVEDSSVIPLCGLFYSNYF